MKKLITIELILGVLIAAVMILILKMAWGQEQTQILDSGRPVRITWTCSENATGYIPERATGEGLFLPMDAVTACETVDQVGDLVVVRYRVRAVRDVTGYGRVFSAYSDVSNRAVAVLYPTKPGGPLLQQ